MERSLSALLPVRNAESSLEATVLEMLEVLPELTRRLELVVIDDCSSDATIEVADEMLGRYPQLRVVRHACPKGRAEAIRTGFERSTGEVVFFADEDCGLTLGEVAKMWRALEEHDLVLGRPLIASAGWLGWRQQVLGPRGGFLMGYRQALKPLEGAMIDQTTLQAHLARLGCRWHGVEIGPRAPRTAPHHAAARARRLFTPGSGLAEKARTDSPSPMVSRPRKPNYLARLKNFALGE